jgi:hypothetical protein
MPATFITPPHDVLASVAASRRVFNAVKALACDVHGSPPGEPCWVIPAAGGHERSHISVCGERIDSLHRHSRATSAQARIRLAAASGTHLASPR